MGWGTFIAGQTIRSIRRSGSGSPSVFYSELFGIFTKRHYTSYRRQVIGGSLLVHPDVQKKVELEIWDEDIHKKLLHNWRKLVLTQVVVFLLAELAWFQLIDSPFWIAHFVMFPLTWRYQNARLIQEHKKSINDELQRNGWNTEKLLTELDSKLQEKKSLEENKKRLHQQQQALERDRRKYGGA
jgi:hypothetical protein